MEQRQENVGPAFTVMDNGQCYLLHAYNSNAPIYDQTLQFVKKELGNDGKTLVLTKNGTTNEAVIAVLIERMHYLNTEVPSKFNSDAIQYLQLALLALQERTKDREARVVEGTNQA